MKDKKAISIHKLAAIARAKALGLEVNRPGISSFERQALEWKRREQAQKSELSSEEHNPESPIQDPEPSIQNPRCRRDLRQVSNIQHPSFPHSAGSPPELRRTSPLRSDKHPSKLNEGFDWQSYRPEQDAAEKKPRDLNTASIALMARKIMAGEWAMALGKRIIDSDQAVIEGKAEKYRKKKAAERERKAIEEQKILKQRAILEETLLFFGRDLLKAPKPITPQAAEVLLAGALSELGECIKINWQPNIWRYTHRTLGGKENEAEKWQPHPCPVSGHHR